MLCSLDKCRWYADGKPDGGRKCWHGEPQCWRGWVDLFISLFKLRFARRSDE